jgi:hypothetical protein
LIGASDQPTTPQFPVHLQLNPSKEKRKRKKKKKVHGLLLTPVNPLS